MPSNSTCLIYAGRLVSSPFPGDLAASEPLSMLLLSEGDYVSLKEFENEVREPVHLSYAQHYAILEDLSKQAAEYFPSLTHILVRFHTVYLRPIPAGLMHPRVLLVNDPQSLAADLLRCGVTEILVIADQFRRDSKERGDNTVTIALHSPVASGERFAAYLRRAAFYRGTTGRDSEPHIISSSDSTSIGMS